MKIPHTLGSELLARLALFLRPATGSERPSSNSTSGASTSGDGSDLQPPKETDSSNGSNPVQKSLFLLDRTTSELDQVTASSEKAFLSLAGEMEKLPACSEEVVRRSERLLSLARGTDDQANAFERTLSLIHRSLAFVDEGQQQLQALSTSVSTAIRNIDRLIASERLLQRSVSALSYVQIHFKIESAPLSHETQLMFQSLTQDMGRLHIQVSETFGEKFRVLRGARSTLTTVVEQLRRDAGTQGQELKIQRSSVDQAMSHLEEDLKANTERDVQITTISQAVDHEIHAMVLALQAQDIVSQKLSHVGKALGVIRNRLANLGQHSLNNGTGGTESEFCRISCKVQDAQIAAIQEDIHQATEDIVNSMGRVKSNCCRLSDGNEGLCDPGKIVSGIDNLIELLMKALEDVRRMISNTVATAEKAFTLIKPIGGMASDLTGAVRQFSVQIRLIALNAQVQAAHQSGGTGLEVLASNTATISAEAGAISESMAAGVDTLVSSLNELVNAFEDLSNRGGIERSALADGSADCSSALRQQRDQTLSELKGVQTDIEGIVESVESMKSLAEGCRNISSKLTPAREAAGQMAAALSALRTDAAINVDPGHFREELSKQFSVASEHETLETVLVSLGARPLEITREAAVELFDTDAEAGQTVATGTPDSTAASDGNDGPPMQKGQPDLGQNVELF